MSENSINIQGKDVMSFEEASVSSKKPTKETPKTALQEWKEAIFQAGILVVIMFFLLWPVRVDGVSMVPTFQDKDVAFMSRLMTMVRWVDRGDVVVFKLDVDRNPLRENYVKRVIGLPGETISWENNAIHINGEPLEEPYVENDDFYYWVEGWSYTLSADEYYVLGDNRNNSMDSRDFGPVTKKELLGKVYFRIFPLKNMRFY